MGWWQSHTLSPEDSRDPIHSFAPDSSDPRGNAYIAVAGQEGRYLTDTGGALRALIREIKAGKADHLLQG
ncbi:MULTISPECIES: hypothetical protein [Streptomyces]|uniref:hypothetical protein n=1 Tax=Streptomyces TaxID=1883 RepID=UPI000B6CDE99|nr:hypothetical protein [Streptomyces sp. CS113]OWA09895.1 hypothetical protein B9W62_12020 [Streptomyces sp. CS113]